MGKEDIFLEFDRVIQFDTSWFERKKKPSLIIGLGGMGIEVVERVKRELDNNIKRNQNDGFEGLSFLLIDSDWKSLNDAREKYGFLKNEIIHIGSDLHPAFPKVLLPKWFDCNISYFGDTNYGASAIRQIGRLLFFIHMQDVYSRISETIHTLLDTTDSPNCSLEIYIITGLAGGTGSGIILDLCYIIRNILSEQGICNRSHINGYLLLPDLLIDQWPNGYINPSFRDILYSNSYASLKELVYFTNLPNIDEEYIELYEMHYGSMRIKSREKPMDLVYLISTLSPDNQMLFSYEQKLKETVEWIVGQLTIVKEVPMSICSANTVFYRFHAKSEKLPLKEMNRYFISFALHQYLEFSRNCLYHDHEYAKAILQRCGIFPNEIFLELSGGEIDIEIFSKPMSENQLNTMIHQYRNRVNVIAKELNAGITDSQCITMNGLLGRIMIDLFRLLRKKGFLIVFNLVDQKYEHSFFKTLCIILDELLARIKANQIMVKSQLEEMKMAEKAYIEAKMFLKKARLKDYLNVQARYYRGRCESITLVEAYNLVDDLSKKLKSLYCSFFRDIQRTLLKMERISVDTLSLFEHKEILSRDVCIKLESAYHEEEVSAIFEKHIEELMINQPKSQAYEDIFDIFTRSLLNIARPILEGTCHEFLTMYPVEAESLVKRITKRFFYCDRFYYRKLWIPTASASIQNVASDIAFMNDFTIETCNRKDGIWYYEIVGDNINFTNPLLFRFKVAYDTCVYNGQHLCTNWRCALPDIEA